MPVTKLDRIKDMDDKKIFSMPFSKVYGCLLAKMEKKGRTKEELNEAVSWLTGYSKEDIERLLLEDGSYKSFFEGCPSYNPLAQNIKGIICGIKIQEIEDPLMKKIRCLDKLVDDLAKGMLIDKVLFRDEAFL